jgi:hypothetical protein
VQQHRPSPFDQLPYNQPFWLVHIVNIDVKIVIDDISSSSNQQGGDKQQNEISFLQQLSWLAIDSERRNNDPVIKQGLC